MDINAIIAQMEAERIPLPVRAYVSLHYYSGARISDLLKVDYTSISARLNISILQGKKSQALVIQPVHFREFWVRVRDNRLTPMQNYNRFYFYRLYKRFGISVSRGGRKNNLVTHAFRKELARDLHALDGNIKRAQGALGHRSASSTEHYTGD